MKYAKSFRDEFVRQFRALCDGRQGAPEFWTDDTGRTKRVLRDEACLLRSVVENWAVHVGLEEYGIEKEWLKFDLMVIRPGQSSRAAWWLSIPIAAIEHENGDGIHDEIWKLACWRARLKVLVTYHRDDDVLAEKLNKASQIIGAVAAEYGPDDAQWLFLSAPRTFAGPNCWQARFWTNGRWEELN